MDEKADSLARSHGDDANAFHAAQWHTERRDQILRSHPEVRALFGEDPAMLAAVVAFPALQVFLAAAVSRLGVMWLLPLSALSAVCMLQNFNTGHELCHNNIVRRLNGAAKDALMRFVFIFDFGGNIYLYYKFKHIPHHTNLGEQSYEEALQKIDCDGDVLGLSSLLRIRAVRGAKPGWLMPALGEGAFARLWYIGIQRPFQIVWGQLVAILTSARDAPRLLAARRDVQPQASTAGASAALSQRALCMVWAVALSVVGGPIVAAFIVLSVLFYHGLFWFPTVSYYMSTHPGITTAETNQPTCSVYCSTAGRMFYGNLNYHVEHHDFPGIPVRRLRRLHAMAREHYLENMYSFTSMLQVMMMYYKQQGALWTYACQGQPAREARAPSGAAHSGSEAHDA